jgi:transcriptional repressor NrdR
MDCPFCESNQIVVVNSRLTRKGIQIWRRRKCLSCKESFTTYERIELSFLKVVKRNGNHEYYKQAKLYSGIYSAVVASKKMDRGDAGEKAEEILRNVEEKILKTKKKEIETETIKEMVMAELLKTDWRSGLRYWAYFSGEERKWLKRVVNFLS